jgi:hypothetical protein
MRFGAGVRGGGGRPLPRGLRGQWAKRNAERGHSQIPAGHAAALPGLHGLHGIMVRMACMAYVSCMVRKEYMEHIECMEYVECMEYMEYMV